MRLRHLLWLFILWLNMDKSLQQNAQCPVIHVGDNVQVTGDPEEATHGNVVRFSCKSNTEILHGPVEIYCNENGEWSGEAPKCDAEIKCNIPIIGNGYVPGDIQEYKEHHVLNFVCNHLYKPAEGRPSKCTKIGDNADWSPTPVCETIKCRLEEARGTSFEPRFKNVFSSGETVSISCAQKYWISNHQTTSAVTTCNNDGNWDISPQCREVICDRRDPFVDRWDAYRAQQIKLDQTVRYWCSSGYKRTDGGTRATCTRYGWKPNPLCQEITCQRKQYSYAEIAGNVKSMYKYNEQVEYNCEDGGHFTLTCGANGWIGSPVCTNLTGCETPPFLTDGDIKYTLKSQYKHNERVEYVCQTYYTMEGEPYRTCKNGEWTGHMRCLNPCVVNESDIRQHNITLTSSDNKYLAHDEIIEFRCARGIPVGAVAMRQRCNSGVIVLPTCQ